MTLKDLERDLYRRLNKNVAVPNGETQARLRAFLNQRHRRLLRDFPFLREDTITFASVASTAQYALPEQGIARINRIYETTNQLRLVQRTRDWLRTTDPSPDSGTPVAWIPNGYAQVHTQPSNASEIFVDSDSASDVNRCYIEGVVTGGYKRKAEVTMTGTTAVTLDSSITSWIRIDKFYLSEAAVGTVTLHEDASGGTELSKIAIGDTYAKYHSVTLWPTPAAVITYTCDITRAITDMVSPLDEPLLPEEFHDLLAIGARVDEYEHTDDARWQKAAVEWDEGVKALTSFLIAHPDRTINLNGQTVPEFSRLGSWFPAGS